MAPSTPPPPLDDTTVSNPLECPPLRWGLIGCGRVSHDFTQALKHLPNAKVVACSARDQERAQEFATKHGINKAYGSYEEMLDDPSVEVVYVGNVHAFRRSVGELCLKANKHVLLEKPFSCKREDAEYLIGLAKERNLFLMEGMWTRFFPAFEKARQLIFGGPSGEEGIMGDVVSVQSDFNFNASDSEDYPGSFVYNRKLGGGATLLVAPYPVAASLAFFTNEPESIQVAGQVDEATGVDLQAAIVMSFPPKPEAIAPAVDPSNTDESTPKLPGAGTALLSYGMLGESSEETTILCTKGRIKICSPGHCPTKLIVSLKATGRGNEASTIEYDFPLPEDTEGITKAGGFVYPNSAGFCYEAAAAARCIKAGKLETPQHTLSETLTSMKVLDEARKQLGTKAVDED